MNNVYVLDTSVVVHNPEVLSELNDSKIIIPIAVIEELDKLKSQYTIVGAHARQFLKILDNLTLASQQDEIKLDNNSILILDANNYGHVGEDSSYGDNKILSCSVSYNQLHPNLILLTRDYNLRIRARVLKVKSEDYSKDAVFADDSEFYTGHKVIFITEEEIRSFHSNKILCVSNEWVKTHKVYPNQFIILKDADETISASCRYYEDQTLRPLEGTAKAFGLSTKNREQNYALELLFDDNVKLVTLAGPAGCGKTLLCTAAALEQVVNQKKYDKFFIIKSIETVGKDIGALPGNKLEKMAPFVQNVMDNVATLWNKSKKKVAKKPVMNKKGNESQEQMINDPYLAMLIDSGVVEIESVAYARGRSIDNAFILIDECQNLTQNEIKTLITRCGFNTKIACTGDLDQLDIPSLNIFNNGMTYIIEKFKDYGIAGHVSLIKGERSELATLASKIL